MCNYDVNHLQYSRICRSLEMPLFIMNGSGFIFRLQNTDILLLANSGA